MMVTEERRSLSTALDTVLPQLTQQQDKAFVQALSYGVLRWYHKLDFILGQLLKKPLKRKNHELRIIALLGLYQLAYTRVKPHAAVSEMVAITPQWGKPLINAVLRNFQRQQTSQADWIAISSSNNEIAHTAHPAWLIDKIRNDWPLNYNDILAENNQSAPMVLRVNQQQCNRKDYMAQLKQANLEAELHPCSKSAIALRSAVDVSQLPGFNQGMVSIQDGAAQLAAPLLAVSAGHRVLDLCAAPGGKTVHLLESYPGLAHLLAVEIDPNRITRIHENLQRTSLNAEVITGDANNPDSWWDKQPFDRILLDAPCSASGVIRRHPDIKHLRQPEDIDTLVITQQQILAASWPLLKPGGLLLYITCSIFKQENEMQINAFLKTTADASEQVIEADWGIPCTYGRQILTGESGMDGFYYACLEKSV